MREKDGEVSKGISHVKERIEGFRGEIRTSSTYPFTVQVREDAVLVLKAAISPRKSWGSRFWRSTESTSTGASTDRADASSTSQ